MLTGHWNDPIPPDVMNEIKQIETWILMFLSSPVPVPGKTKVQLEVGKRSVPNNLLSLPKIDKLGRRYRDRARSKYLWAMQR